MSLPLDDESLIALDIGAVPAEPPVAQVVVMPRFCRQCGTAWRPEWTDCTQCVISREQPVVPLTVIPERQALKSAVSLYFCLLAVCAIGILAATEQNNLYVQFGEMIGLSAITIGWCAGSWRTVVPLLTRMPQPAWLAAAIGLSLVSFGIAVGVIRGLDHLMGLRYADGNTPYLAAGFGWAMIVLCTCIQPAVIEELAFRGIIFGALQKALSPAETIVVSAMMFMILHLSVGRFPHTLALGLASGLLRYRTRSIYPCMLMHFSHNLLCVLSDAMLHS